MAVVTQVLLLRKPDSYTVAIYEFRGSRRWRRGGAGERLGEGGGGGRATRRSVHLNSDWVKVFGEAWK